jgi:hypothetical protein
MKHFLASSAVPEKHLPLDAFPQLSLAFDSQTAVFDVLRNGAVI